MTVMCQPLPPGKGTTGLCGYAVEQVCDSDKVRRNKEGVPIEVDVTAHLVHPNLVRTIESATAFKDRPQKVDWEVKQDSEAAQTASPSAQKQDPQASAQPIEETWLLLEYCDQGCFIVSLFSYDMPVISPILFMGCF